MELDINWIDKYEKEELIYKDFYKDDIKYIKIYSLMINKNLLLENIHEETFFLEEKNILIKYNLIFLINKYKNNKNNKNKINLLSILKYNIDLDSNNIFNYLKQETEPNMFLKSLTSIDDIVFEPTITLFEDLTSLFIIYNEEQDDKKDINSNNQTKRIILHSNHKKTKKMKYHKV